MRKPLPPIEMIRIVAQGLGDLRSEVAFLGGAILGLLITDSAAREARPTEDVDLVIDVATTIEYNLFEEKLRKLGFENVIEGPICRFRYMGILLDLMPTSDDILGFGNRWYSTALSEAEERVLGEGLVCRVIRAPCFLATKLEAFDSPTRENHGDYLASRDFEDIVSVIDGRREIVDEVASAQDTVRTFLKERIGSHLHQSRFEEGVAANLDIDRASRARVQTVLRRFQEIAGQN